MSPNKKEILGDILEKITRHKNLYRSVEIKSVVARREDIPGREGKWHNFVTLIKMLDSSNLRPWKIHLEKDNFAILSAILSIDRFKEILERLTTDQVLEVDVYRAFGPFNFGQREFLGSEQSRKFYDIDWAVDVWRIDGKDNLGLPNTLNRELESEIVPFKYAGDAIKYHIGLTHEGYEKIRNSIHIVAPSYYARIEKVDLSGRQLFVKIYCNVAKPKDLRIRFNVEGCDERTNYYKILEAHTVQPDEDAMTIDLKQDAEIATIWLHHIKGHVVDYRRTRRKPSIETIEKQLSLYSDNPQLSEEEADVLTKTINLRSEADMPALLTTEQGVDSIDVEILKAVKILGGDYAKCIPEVLKYLSINMLLSRLARLKTLGFITLQPPRKILLTPAGIDAVNLPPGVLSARIPPEIARRIAEIRIAFQNEDYDEVTNSSTRLLEAILRKRLEEKFSRNLQDVWPNLNLGDYNRASLGILKEACLKLKVFRKNSVTDHILSTLLKLRVPMSHEKEGGMSPPDIALLTLRLVETFARQWYYIES